MKAKQKPIFIYYIDIYSKWLTHAPHPFHLTLICSQKFWEGKSLLEQEWALDLTWFYSHDGRRNEG